MGWVKNWRQIEDWEWYKIPNMAHLFQHLIRRANHEPQKWQGVTIERGQLVTSYPAMANQTGLSIQEVRTCVSKLKSTSELTCKSTSRFTLITIANYDTYQEQQQTSNKEVNAPINFQATDHQPTINRKQEYKNDKNNKEEENILSDFETFWKVYPKRKSKRQAEKIWAKIKPDEALLKTILSAIEKAKGSLDWTKDNGQYIPYPSTWLNGKRWEDEVTEKPPPQQGDPDWYPTEEFITEIEQANGIFRDENGAVINAK